MPDSPQRARKWSSESPSSKRSIQQQRKTQEAPPEGTLPPKPTTPVAPPPSATTTPPPAAETRAPWYRDTAAMTLAALGVAALGAGVGLTIKGNLDLSHSHSAADLQDHDNLRSSGITFSAAGYATLGVGAALCVAAVIKWAVRPKHQRVALGFGATGVGALVTAGGTF